MPAPTRGTPHHNPTPRIRHAVMDGATVHIRHREPDPEDQGPYQGPRWDVVAHGGDGQIIATRWSLARWWREADKPYANCPHLPYDSDGWVILTHEQWDATVTDPEFSVLEDRDRLVATLGVLFPGAEVDDRTGLPEEPDGFWF